MIHVLSVCGPLLALWLVTLPPWNSGVNNIPYILESNPHPFYSFRRLKNQMRITIACGLDSRSRAGFWKNDRATVRAVRTIQYNNILFYLLLIIIIYCSSDFWHIIVLCRNASPIRCMNLMAHPLLALKRLWGMFKDVAFFIASSQSRS